MMHVGDILSTVGNVQYRGGCSVPWGISSRVILSNVGDIISPVGGYLEYREGYSVLWGDIMSNVVGVQYHGVLK